MNRIEMSFVEFHNPFFMQGTNLGTKLFAKQKNATLFYDLDHSFMIITFKGRVALVPSTNIISMDVIDYSSLDITPPHPVIHVPQMSIPSEDGNSIPMSDEAQAAMQHRKEVRERSANSNKAPSMQETNNSLIQASRNAALGMKHPQIDNPTKPAQGQTGKNKIMSHAQLKAQIAQEAKDVKPA
jgi:hypothetical protein